MWPFKGSRTQLSSKHISSVVAPGLRVSSCLEGVQDRLDAITAKSGNEEAKSNCQEQLSALQTELKNNEITPSNVTNYQGKLEELAKSFDAVKNSEGNTYDDAKTAAKSIREEAKALPEQCQKYEKYQTDVAQQKEAQQQIQKSNESTRPGGKLTG